MNELDVSSQWLKRHVSSYSTYPPYRQSYLFRKGVPRLAEPRPARWACHCTFSTFLLCFRNCRPSPYITFSIICNKNAQEGFSSSLLSKKTPPFLSFLNSLCVTLTLDFEEHWFSLRWVMTCAALGEILHLLAQKHCWWGFRQFG